MRQYPNRLNLFLGLTLVVLGVLFLLSQVFHLELTRYIWPLVVIAFGTVFFVGYFSGGREGAFLAIPGAVIISIGLLLLVINIFDIWQTWAYAWTLMVAAAGVGLSLTSQKLGNADMRRTGGFLIRLGLLLFIGFGFFFEGLINLSGFGLRWGILWPVVLIAFGLFLLAGQVIRSIRRR